MSKENKNILTIFWCLFYIIYISLLTAAIVYTSTPLIDYLLGSINISFGYSSAMSLVGSPWQLGLAISQIILILIIFYFVLAEGNIINICLNMSLIFVLFMSFKHGFVRQDIHTLAFATVTHLIVAIYISKLKRIKAKKFAYSVFIYLFLTWLLFPLEPTKNYTYTSVEKFFNLDQFYQKTSVLFNINSYREELNRASLNNLDKVKLPSSIMQILQHKTVDIFPWEVSIAGANDIKWKPRPVFQSYVAYTSFLDLINSESLENNPRDYIIYQFGSLDGRHPFTYEPATFFYIACNYRLSSKMPDFFKTYALSNLMLLEKRQSNLCSSPLTEEKLSVKWNNYLELKDQDFTLANINFNYSFWGNLYKKLFRIPPIMMQINLIDGSSYSYRIISENSNSGKGIIVSHLPTTDSEALSFFRGDLFAQVKSLKFSINNKFLFKQNINLVLTTYNFQSTYSEGRKRIDISHLESINFSHNLSNEYIGWIDSKHDNIKRGDMINAVGWATSIISGNPVWVLLTEGLENKPIAIARTTSPRPDVVNFYKNNDYGYSGWSVTFSSNNLKYKKNNIRAWVYEPATNKAIPLNGEYIVEIY
ncbi:MAG TPA: hypothetical protein DEP38_06340 [Cyanobacteria bacterium UBA9226]|nr:hypothetical protein [Cyanobacteria bacterium UBA9226]